MTLATAAVEQIEKRMPKVVNARTHGVIDYCHAALFFGLAIFCRRKEPRAAVAALLTGSFILVESILTDYPLGAKKIIPFETHGNIDAGLAASSFLVPKVFGFEGTPAATIFKANGFAEGMIVGMTDWNSERAGAEGGVSPNVV